MLEAPESAGFRKMAADDRTVGFTPNNEVPAGRIGSVQRSDTSGTASPRQAPASPASRHSRSSRPVLIRRTGPTAKSASPRSRSASTVMSAAAPAGTHRQTSTSPSLWRRSRSRLCRPALAVRLALLVTVSMGGEMAAGPTRRNPPSPFDTKNKRETFDALPWRAKPR